MIDLKKAKKLHDFERQEYAAYSEKNKEARQALEVLEREIYSRLSTSDNRWTIIAVLKDKLPDARGLTDSEIEVDLDDWGVRITGLMAGACCNPPEHGIFIPLDDVPELLKNGITAKSLGKYYVDFCK